MTNSAALIKNSIWRKAEFRALPRLAQCTYMQLLGLKDIDRAGLFQLNTRQLVRGCDELTVESLWADLRVLEATRWVFVDEDTDEGFIRHYMSTFEIVKYPQYLQNAYKGARMVESPKIRVALAAELRALKRAEATAVADEIDPDGTVPSPSEHGPSTVHRDVTVIAPTSRSSSRSKSLLVSGQVGEEPSPHCSNHPNGTDRNCFACGQARKSYPERKADWDAERASAAIVARNAAIKACLICDEFGEITFDDAVAKCTHQEADHA